ncbi:MAG: glycosyltransferase family 39 protein [Acidimicrobiales bacterium]|nr:glycosyltransferase family 39 protein [Acidimicrobiales bacterium]
MSDRRIVLGLFLLAFGLVVAVHLVAPSSSVEATDYDEWYRPIAEAIRAGDGLSLDGQPAVRYPPGYPALLAALSTLPLAEGATNAIVNAVSLGAVASLLFLVVRRLADRRTAAVCGLAVTTYPLFLVLAAAPGPDLPFMALVVAAVLALLHALEGRLWWAVACGALVGGAGLLRPAAAGLGLVLAGLGIVWRRDRRGLALAAVLLVTSIAVVLPWEVWVYQQTEQVVVLGTVGPPTVASGLTIVGRDEADGREFPVPEAVDELGRRALARKADLQDTRGLVRFLGDELQRNVDGVVMLVVVKGVRSWFGTDSMRHEGVVALIQLPYLALAVVGLWSGRHRRLLGLSLTMAAYFWLTTIVAVSIVRYLLPGMAFVLVLTAIGLVRILPVGRVAGRA